GEPHDAGEEADGSRQESQGAAPRGASARRRLRAGDGGDGAGHRGPQGVRPGLSGVRPLHPVDPDLGGRAAAGLHPRRPDGLHQEAAGPRRLLRAEPPGGGPGDGATGAPQPERSGRRGGLGVGHGDRGRGETGGDPAPGRRRYLGPDCPRRLVPDFGPDAAGGRHGDRRPGDGAGPRLGADDRGRTGGVAGVAGAGRYRGSRRRGRECRRGAVRI
ncbi:MAG: hypothetical protein AVDCRST_MAG59-231, partial [uncultured Thermomicrobiales bacterium]